MIVDASGNKMEVKKQLPGLGLGRVVHFCNGPREDRKGPEVWPAIVTRVYDDAPGVVDLTVFMSGTTTFASEVPHQDGEAYKDLHWSWPPKV